MLYLEGERITCSASRLPAARIEENFFIFVEVVALIFVPHMGEVVKHPQVGAIEGVKSTPARKLADFKYLFNTTFKWPPKVIIVPLIRVFVQIGSFWG